MTETPDRGRPARITGSREARAALLSDGGTRRFTALVVDIVGMHAINDFLGHHVGDEIVAAVGERLLAAAGPSASVHRVSAKYVLLWPEAAGVGVEDARKVAAAVSAVPPRAAAHAPAASSSVSRATWPASKPTASLYARNPRMSTTSSITAPFCSAGCREDGTLH